MNGIEDRLKDLMMRSLAGEAAAHRDLLAFVATWYALGIFTSGALGAMAGRLVLKW